MTRGIAPRMSVGAIMDILVEVAMVQVVGVAHTRICIFGAVFLAAMTATVHARAQKGVYTSALNGQPSGSPSGSVSIVDAGKCFAVGNSNLFPPNGSIALLPGCTVKSPRWVNAIPTEYFGAYVATVYGTFVAPPGHAIPWVNVDAYYYDGLPFSGVSGPDVVTGQRQFNVRVPAAGYIVATVEFDYPGQSVVNYLHYYGY